MQPVLVPDTGRPYNPVATLNGWSLPWRMKDNVKEFHLVAEPVVREFAPGMKANLWGYNGQSPGPTIEAVEGDRVGSSSRTGFRSTPPFTGTACWFPRGWMASAA